MSTLNYLGQQVEWSRDHFWMTVPGSSEPTWCKPSCALPYAEDTWKALFDLFQRDWFGRLWVVQEIQLGNRLSIVRCGTDEIPFSNFRRAILTLSEKRIPNSLSRPMLNRVAYFCDTNTKTPFGFLLQIGRYKLNANNLDKIYGLLSLVSPRLANTIHPDYLKTAAAVYTEVLIAHVELVQRLELLQHCCLELRLPGAPSWVPNWSERPLYAARATTYIAAGFSAARVNFISMKVLEVLGCLCMTVRAVSQPAANELREIHNFMFQSVYENDKDIASAESESDLNALIDVLTLGRLRERFPNVNSLASLGDVRDILLSSKANSPCDNLSEDDALQRLQMYGYDIKGRCLFRSAEGKIGRAPRGTVPGKL